jgi:hypothetical protein
MTAVGLAAWCRRPASALAALILCAIAWSAAAAESQVSGDYDAQGRSAQGQAYQGAVRIAPLGQGYGIAWRLAGGDTYRGVALKVDSVLGAVYWSDRQRLDGVGIVLYRIDGGELQGLWMPARADATVIGRENLKGSPDLAGRYQITLGENPDNMTNYDGHVEIARQGDTYRLEWFTPDLSAVGNGIRLGDILVVGYAVGQAPGTVGYCVTEMGLLGLWSFGQETALGKEVLRRQGVSAAPSPDASQQAGCAPK